MDQELCHRTRNSAQLSIWGPLGKTLLGSMNPMCICSLLMNRNLSPLSTIRSPRILPTNSTAEVLDMSLLYASWFSILRYLGKSLESPLLSTLRQTRIKSMRFTHHYRSLVNLDGSTLFFVDTDLNHRRRRELQP